MLTKNLLTLTSMCSNRALKSVHRSARDHPRATSDPELDLPLTEPRNAPEGMTNGSLTADLASAVN